MRIRLGLIAAVALTAATYAQTRVNVAHNYNGRTNATSRSGVSGNTKGDVMAKWRGNEWRGLGQIGNANGLGRLNGFRFWLQDQNAASVEQYDFVMIKGNTAKGKEEEPDPAMSAIVLRTASINSPGGPNAVRAWVITANFQSPSDTVPQTGTLFTGMGLPINQSWTADGLSIHMASYRDLTGNQFPKVGENPRNGAPNGVWTITRPANVINQASPTRAHRICLLTEADYLNPACDIIASARRTGGANNPDPGYAGEYPDSTARRDGSAFQFVGAPGTGLIMLSGKSSTQLTFPFIRGTVYLDPLTLTQLTAVTFTGAAAGQMIAPPFMAQGSLPPLIGEIYFQAFRLSGGTLIASNGTSIDYQ